MNEKNPLGLSIFIDIRNSTKMQKIKVKIYNIFYNKFRNIEGKIIDDLKLNSASLFYKAFVGDAVFLHYKCGELQDEIIELITKIQEMTKTVEKEITEKNISKVKFGIGIAYGEYENIEGGNSKGNQSIPISSYIDYAAKASSIARKNSEYYFAIKLKPTHEKNTNKQLKEFIEKYNDIFEFSTSSSKKNFRFSLKQ